METIREALLRLRSYDAPNRDNDVLGPDASQNQALAALDRLALMNEYQSGTASVPSAATCPKYGGKVCRPEAGALCECYPGKKPSAAYDSRPDTWAHIDQVRFYLGCVQKHLIDRAHAHDKTKLLSPEVETFDEFTPKLRDLTYGSDEYRAATKAMGPALAHHYEHNSHHPEHYENEIAGMSLLDLIEMVCDWKAAGERHVSGGDIMRSIALNQERWGYSDELRSILEATARELFGVV